MSADRIEADYLIETSGDPRWAAEVMAGEQSSGTFLPVPGETVELKARAAAKVESLTTLGRAAVPALPGAAAGQGVYTQAQVTLSWPLSNLGPSLPNLVATIAGNLFELRPLSGIRLTDFRLPEAFVRAYPGPRFSVEGTRRLSGVYDRPLIGTIVKPSVGLTSGQTAELVDSLCAAGIDFIKDDELQSDGPGCSFEARTQAVMTVLRRHADRSGRMVMYAFNLTGELDEMRRRHDLVHRLGGTCVMASLNSVGLVGMLELARHCQIPIHGHRNGWGYLSRHPLLGWSYVAWQKLWRLAGVDHLHVNGLANKFCEPDETVLASARECLTALAPSRSCLAMPVFSSGQTVRQVPATLAGLGSTDLIFAAGGGLLAHPGGPAAGVASLRQAWDAAIAGIDLTEHARRHSELAQALEAYR